MPYEDLLTDIVTLWKPKANDGFGGSSYFQPIQIKGRWQDYHEKLVDSAGVSFISVAVVYTNQGIDLGSWMALNYVSNANPQSAATAFMVKRVEETWNPDKTIVVYKNILG